MVFLDILEPQVLVEIILDHQDIVATQEFQVLVELVVIQAILELVGSLVIPDIVVTQELVVSLEFLVIVVTQE